jgi:TrmH family RNA methyltransferase
MRNFGLGRLCVVGSEGITSTREARALAHCCEEMLESARRCSDLDAALASHVMAVGTANRVRKGKLPPLLGPAEVLPVLESRACTGSCALVFGPESTGLTDQELARCTLLLKMPTAVEQPSLNLSQAVLVVAQACWLHAQDPDREHLPRLAPQAPTHAEFELLLDQVQGLMERNGFRPYAGDPEHYRLAARRSLLRGNFERRDLRTLLTMVKYLEHKANKSASS